MLIASVELFDNLHIREIIDLARKGPVAEVYSKLQSTARQRMTEQA